MDRLVHNPDGEEEQMLEATSIQAQLADARGDPLRVLVVGAGVAGVTLAQLLRREGLHPVLVERSGRQAGSGYMLALMPLVDPVMAALGARDAYLAASVGLDRYRFRNPAGRQLGQYSLATLFDRFGDYRGISRDELLGVLGSAGGAVTYGATVTALARDPGAVTATLDDGSAATEAEFDLVVAADGLHSGTRGLVLEPGRAPPTTPAGAAGWPGPNPTRTWISARSCGAPASSSAPTRSRAAWASSWPAPGPTPGRARSGSWPPSAAVRGRSAPGSSAPWTSSPATPTPTGGR